MHTRRSAPNSRAMLLGILCWLTAGSMTAGAADFLDPNADRNALPTVPAGFGVSIFAREPLVRQPCSMAFDARGRLCVGMGPQYRNPKPDTPGDSVVLVLDDNGDGVADHTKIFATGFNAIQGLAWRGRDLWVANAPDLTVVRDLDGDDQADEYVRVYTDLGNLEHGLHGLNWAPDGKLYMSKGNSKGLTETGRIAPKPFRDLWGVSAPAGSPDFPEPSTFKSGDYRKAYHDPADDWGREGGVLRCDDGGANLEIVARGFRNPWDIAFDTGFNWLGTDNDQTTGDRVFMPFFGAHFGWNHPWSAHWGTESHEPSAPVSGPLFEGSGTGVVFGDSPQFPASHRGVFFINDWLRKTTFVWRPRWDGALLRPLGEWEPFVQGGNALFRPTDLEVGPDGALWILGWSAGYGAEYQGDQMTSEGRVFRVASTQEPLARWQTPKRNQALARWTVADLVEDFDGPLPVWRSDAQDELVRRGISVKADLISTLEIRGLSQARETWTAWTLGRLAPQDRTIDAWFAARAEDPAASLNLRLQSLRILAQRVRQLGAGTELPASLTGALRSPEPRLRFEAVQAIGQARQRSSIPALLELLAVESDATTFYAGWQTLRGLQDKTALRPLLSDPRNGVRRAALLALLEDHALQEAEVKRLATDPVGAIREMATLWLRKASGGGEPMVVRGRPLNTPATEPAPIVPRIGVARHIKARSGARYTLSPAGLRSGAKPYTDRNYDLKQVPAPLAGLDFIQTANNDDGAHAEEWLSFEALVPVRVHVAFDTRASTLPKWLRERFQPTGRQIRADHWTFQVYTREFPAGPIVLGGNTDDGKAGGKGNYIVALEPMPLPPPAGASAIDPILALLPQGDAERGEWLFHANSGAGCFQCHRLRDHGNGFGPDLATVGDRSTARHIVQSMLEPSAVITEGFQLQTVETTEGEYSGILLEESGLTLTLGLATGQRQGILKSKIKHRQTAATSAMPGYDRMLASGYVADLTAYLLAQKASAPGPDRELKAAQKQQSEATRRSSDAPASAVPAASGNGVGFRFTELPDRLVITHTHRPVAEFVFRDDKILRPYFRNVHAPNGVQATRNHPPIAGADATDHDTMHSGLWLAFGDINGTDFWRNKGRMEHVRFVEPPSVRDGRLVFTTECRLLTTSGEPICSLTNHLSLESQTNAWLLGWDASFTSQERDVTFGDQEEMGFAARVSTPLTESNGGLITSSAGLKSAKATWGQAADWCDYSGTVNGQRLGITLFTHAQNFRASWWHNRDYGVFVANPFGRAAMKQGVASAVTVKRGEHFQLRFAAAVHAGEGYDPAETYRRLATPAAAVFRVPLLGWHSIPERELTLERFRELANMGLTHSLMSYTPAGSLKALDLAQQVGVKLFLEDGRFAKPGDELTQAVRQFRNHPALGGYTLRDEPSLSAFEALAISRDALKAADPAHASYVNLLPTYASAAQLGTETYLGHVRRFLIEFRPEVLSFDHYPILEGNRLRGDFYQNLEWIRQASLEFATPFWAFALTCPHKPYPMPTAGHLRLQVWSNFAYGARGLQYFTYWTPTPGTWDFHDAPIKLDGTRSPTYERVRELNHDVQSCAEILLQSRVVTVYHTAPLPTGTQGIDAACPFRTIAGGEALVALHALPAGERYALVVNRSITAAATLNLTLQSWVRSVTWEHRVRGVKFQEAKEGIVTLELEPGAGAFLRLH